jgi:hypothetical protein
MLSPGWLGETPTGLADVESADRGQTERDIANVSRELLMRFGRHGQTLSSPMMRALAESELTSRGALQRRSGERRYGAYQQRLGMLPQLLQMATSRPYQAAALLRSGAGDFLRSILGYLSASKGQPVVTTEQKSGVIGDLIGI